MTLLNFIVKTDALRRKVRFKKFIVTCNLIYSIPHSNQER